MAGSDLLVVGALLGPEHAASYSMTNRLFATFATYPQQILLIAMPSLVAIHAESGPLTAMRRLKTLSMLAAWGTMALGAVTIAANPSFVGAWVGADHFAGRFVTMLLPVTAFARILRLSPAVGLVAAGQQRVISIAAVCSGVLSVAAAISLGHWFGMSGVIVGYALGASVIELPANLVNYARVIETPAREWLRAHLPVVLVLLGSWSIAAAISYWITAPRFDHAIVAVMGAGATVLVTSAPLLFLREFRAEMTSRMRQLSERASKYIPRRASGKA